MCADYSIQDPYSRPAVSVRRISFASYASTEQSSYSAVLSAPPVSLSFYVGFRQFTSVTLKFWSGSKMREALRFFLALRHIGSQIRLRACLKRLLHAGWLHDSRHHFQLVW